LPTGVLLVQGACPNRDSPGVIRQEGDPNEIHADGLRGRGRLAPAATSRERTLAGTLNAYMEAMAKAGVLQSTTGLEPSSAATTVRVVNDKTQVLDGPYADSKEQLGGFHIIDVPDLDAAISWAARSPTALHGVVEVRPL